MVHPRLRTAACVLALVAFSASCVGRDAENPSLVATAEKPADASEADGRGDHAASEETTPPAPPAPPPIEGPAVLSEDEVYPNAKGLAAEAARALTTYDIGTPVEDVVAGIDPAGDPAAFVDAARQLHHADSWSRGRVIYPQLGGVTPDRVSVMVVTEQRIGTDGTEQTEVRTIDVRLLLRDDVWVVEAVADVGGAPVVPAGELLPEARAVLDDPRIELPDSARWDIIAGDVAPTLLRVMSRAADISPYGVVVLSTGHPFEVFGTERQSDHTRGRAVDIYRVGEESVIDDREPGSPTYEFVEWFYEQPELRQIGSPWALDGFRGRSFTDVVHQDHLHVAVRDEPAA